MARDKKPRKLTDADLAVLLESRIKKAVGYYDTVLSEERRRVIRYYDGVEPQPFHRGNSQYVSQDVYDSVETMRATLLETFCGNSRPVQFAPMHERDVVGARIATEYCTYVVFRLNPGYQILSDVIFDGLMARVGVVKVWWEDDPEFEERVYEAPNEDQLLMALTEAPDDLEITEVAYQPDGSVAASVRYLKRRGRIRIQVIPPEEFGITPRAKSIREAPLVYHRTRKTESELIEEGYDPRVIRELASQDDHWLASEPELVERHRDIDGTSVGFCDELQKQTRSILVYEVYAKLDIEGEGVARLWKVVLAGGKVLHKEPVKRAPFVAFVPLPVSHRFHGSNFAAKVIPTQNARTALTRSIIDHAMITNNPRMTVLRGGVVNPKELMEQRIGGIVNITRPDALGTVPQSSLNPFVFQTIQMLDEDKEETTGISKLSSGLNKDAISKQNSADLVQQMVTLSQQRQKIIARNFAEFFLKELFLLVYQIALENDDAQTMIEVAGKYVPVNPKSWEERTLVQVEFALGYGEQDREAQKHVFVYQQLAQDPVLAPSFGPEQRYNLARRAIELMGIKDVTSYLAPPQPPPPTQPDPLQIAQIEALRAQAQAALMRAENEREKIKADFGLKQIKLGAEVADMQADNAREDERLAMEKATNEAEVSMLRTAKDKRAIISPSP